MKSWTKVLRQIAWLTQLGLSLVAPPLLCAWGSWWLMQRFSLGGWVMVLGIVLGLGASASSAMQFYRMMCRQAEKDAPKQPEAFNEHE